MREPADMSHTDLGLRLPQSAGDAWNAMQGNVRFARHRQLIQIYPIQEIKVVGTHDSEGAWSITPYPGTTGFGELGLIGCKHIHDRLCGRVT
ncbi:hypothetical protein [uncultured Tateyamaria sp.]|uniref:hypothetical protein n=1 Tax=Tateyamaria sp. 1078 TaxID=3417464 RepID=UPI002623007C|nr:hypothetical protein [uncultured Tateyamaria sp.]